MTPVLNIGDYNYSSWSMRPWLALRWAGIGFETRVISLGPRYGQINPDIAAVSPTARVPVLAAGSVTVWDSLAICEWAAERSAAGPLWPEDADLRAVARSAAAEMHAGFQALRRDLPMNLRRRKEGHSWSADAAADIARVDALWCSARAMAGPGPWLFGARSIADAMFTPVATRFRTYAVPLSPVAQAVCDTLLEDADFRDWDARAAAEQTRIGETDAV